MSPLEWFRRKRYQYKRRKLIEKLMHAKWSPAIEAQAESRFQRYSEEKINEQKLAQYNAEVYRGIVHTETYQIEMMKLQKEWDEQRAQNAIK